jgi:hypothetical protein
MRDSTTRLSQRLAGHILDRLRRLARGRVGCAAAPEFKPPAALCLSRLAILFFGSAEAGV